MSGQFNYIYDENNCTNHKSSRQEVSLGCVFERKLRLPQKKNKYITWIETENLFFATVPQRPFRTGTATCILHASQGFAL